MNIMIHKNFIFIAMNPTNTGRGKPIGWGAYVQYLEKINKNSHNLIMEKKFRKISRGLKLLKRNN